MGFSGIAFEATYEKAGQPKNRSLNNQEAKFKNYLGDKNGWAEFVTPPTRSCQVQQGMNEWAGLQIPPSITSTDSTTYPPN
jgi:hypothetical protein